jgi:hypothetical protein
MPSYKTAFGSFLKTEDLQGRAATVTIEEVAIAEVKNDDGTQKKLVAHFVGKDKALILNRTNCEVLEEIIGTDDYGAWGGHRVVIYPTTTKFGPKTVPCLRIRAVRAAEPPPPPPPPAREPGEDDDTGDEIGF